MVRLDILSDPICPWCYIGRTLLGQALAERPDHPFEIHWQPFRLNPEMPAEGMDRRAYLEGKFGGPEAAAEAYAPVRERAAEAGLEIDFDAIPRTPATTDAHRLLHWAEVEGCQDAVALALFGAYFHEGRDISDREVLADIADSHGIDAGLIARLLASDADIDEVTGRDAQFRDMGVTGVPTFIVAGQHAVPGCQPPEMWTRVIDEMAGQAAGSAGRGG